jgi:hypothetical protein
MNAKVLLDIAQLRQMESELAASEVRRKFLKEKAAWLKQRINKGYSSEMNELWTIGSKVIAVDDLTTPTPTQMAFWLVIFDQAR